MAEISATQWRELSPLLDELLEAQDESASEDSRRSGATTQRSRCSLKRCSSERTAIERDAFLEGGAFTVSRAFARGTNDRRLHA